MTEIKGEYWIYDGNVDFADGDVGDYNHESIAMSHVFNKFANNISSLAEELDIEHEIEHYGELDTEAMSNLLQEIEDQLGENETPFIIPLNFDYATQTLKKINNTQSIVLSKLYKDLNNSLEGSIINGKEVKMADVGSNGVEIIYSDDSYEQIPWHSTVKYTGNVTL